MGDNEEQQALMKAIGELCEKRGVGCDIKASFWKDNWKHDYDIKRNESKK